MPRRYGISADAREVFNLLGAVTTAIDHYLQGQPAGMSLGAISKVRTAAHHQLLLLPPTLDFQDINVFSPYIYEACRTTALIYSFGVIFPVSNAYNLQQELVRRLRGSLESFEGESWEDGISGLRLWMLVLGGIAASDGPCRTWIVEQLRRFVRIWEICEWRSVKEVLRSFLWLESACDNGGRLLWSEVIAKC